MWPTYSFKTDLLSPHLKLLRQLSIFSSVRISKFSAHVKFFEELLLVIFPARKVCEHSKALLHKVFLGHAQDLLLQSLPRNVKREIFRIHDALDKIQPLQDELVTVIRGEHAADVQLDVVAFLLGPKHLKRCTTWHEWQRTELQLTFHGEMLHGQVIVPIVRKRFPHAERFVFVELLQLV